MDKLTINFDHCFTAYQREILGDDKCKEIALNILRRFEIGLEIKKQTFQELDKLKEKNHTQMLTIEQIKEYCIQVDLENVLDGETIGACGGDFDLNFTCEKEIRLYYHDINVKDLLKAYVSYNALECLKADEPEHYRKTYNLDILSILELL